MNETCLHDRSSAAYVYMYTASFDILLVMTKLLPPKASAGENKRDYRATTRSMAQKDVPVMLHAKYAYATRDVDHSSFSVQEKSDDAGQHKRKNRNDSMRCKKRSFPQPCFDIRQLDDSFSCCYDLGLGRVIGRGARDDAFRKLV
eukprot:CAMPEP_0184390824 /NCGR_PEP_ID=MMETSP0007-20130409/13610_1 /TAXON_ID=97485 /ORGANISM="Prymnesium parvum, Strain Texoma1" /LENGTH=144 /DNA_ID=CAMNT_0026740705 /DNA_START=262 /DNA_END=693 /DNA_ORIENTATION=-